jgi:TonB-linked SusC/RagA family outer membrane protein
MMNMKLTIFNLLQTGVQRMAVCALALGFTTVGYAQSGDDEEEEEEVETAIAQPTRSQMQRDNYPLVTLRGIVTEQATGTPLAGIQLQALGYPRYTAMTEEDGRFAIRVPVFATSLYVHAPEYLSQQVAVIAGDSTQALHVQMLSDRFQPMYGKGTTYTATKTALSDAFGVTIDGEIANKLGGDVHAVMHSAAAEGGAAMFIRGLNSITCDAQPLIVIDGVEQDMQRDRTSLHIGQFNNLLASISPDDIERITVLKNATALYGARGANGVVLIDTKRGKSMATRIDANVSAGVQLIPQLPTMMNAAQYRNYASELLGSVPYIKEYKNFYFLNDDPNGYYYHTYHNNTDWTDLVYRTALTQNYSINVQGGDDVGMYNLSVGYVDSNNTLEESRFNRMNVRFNTDIKILWNLTTRFDISISRTNSNIYDDGMPANFSTGTVTSPTALSLIKSPLLAPYEYNATVKRFTNLLSGYDNILASSTAPHSALKNQSLANPLSILDNGTGDNKNKAEDTYFTVHVMPVWQFARDFKLTADFNYLLNRNAQRYYRPYEGVPEFEIEEMGTVTSKVASLFSKEQNFMGRLQVDWSKQMGRHTLAAYVGARYNYFSFDSSDLGTQYTGVTDDKNPRLSSSYFPDVDGANDVWKNILWYGNADYNYMNRYFATLSLSMEANSRFGDNADGLGLFGVKWAVFPSLQLGWVLTNESWFPRNTAINYLRLNAGYDISGNDGISNYAARTSFTAVKYYGNAMGIQLTNIGNDEIQWEKTSKLNLGMQSYMLGNRLAVGFDYFLHKTDNLLTLKNFSNPVGGINRYWSNGGALENQGFEVSVSGKPVVAKDWRMEIGATVGHYKNKVTRLPDGDYTSSIYGDNNIITSVGNPVAMFYGYQTEGIFATDAEAAAAGNGTYLAMTDNAGNRTYFMAGDVHFTDQNHDGVIDEQDKTIIGDPNPDIYGNIFATLAYKNLTLNIGFNYSLGNDVYNYQRSVLNSGSNFFNQQVASTARWRYEGQKAEMPRAVFGDPMGNNRFSDRWIEDGSYLRLKTVSLSYRVPVPDTWTWLQGLTVWGEARNLLTFTKYLGSDPEFSVGNGVLFQGIDSGLLSQGRSFMAGLKINL